MEFCARAATFGDEPVAGTQSSGGDAGAAVKTGDASRRLQRDPRGSVRVVGREWRLRATS
jgi:hypothetical protein